MIVIGALVVTNLSLVGYELYDNIDKYFFKKENVEKKICDFFLFRRALFSIIFLGKLDILVGLVCSFV